MPGSLYDTLGVGQGATSVQIRAAYRRLVLKHHPDQAGSEANPDLFIQITKAYEVLIDPERRREYDRLLALRLRPAEPAPKKAPPRKPEPPRPAPTREEDLRKKIIEDLGHLTRLYGKGSFAEAERLARQIIQNDPRQATAYAILGDLARIRGDLAEGARLYAFAVQMDPRNPAYQRKHEELLSRLAPNPQARLQRSQASGFAIGASFMLVIAAGAYVGIAREPAVLKGWSLVSTWTFGLIVMLFLSGVTIGAGLSLGGLLDDFDSLAANAVNKPSPVLALASVAIVSYWAAVALYAVAGARERTHSYSISRLMAGVSGVVLVMAGAAALTDRIDPLQVLLWGGNLAYLGAICGWMAADTVT